MTIPAGTLVPRDARDFGSYELIAKLATGGMAEIFLARPSGQGFQELLVLKRILPHLAEDEHFVVMFRDEADLASKLIHPNVCLVHGFGEYAGTWFIAMEYLHGVALSRMMTRLSKASKVLDIRTVAGIICQACEGLHHAHEVRGSDGALMGVVHRDVSPPNIMVCADGTVKLLDFGIAKARGANSKTRTGTVKGKNAYMSPEQILGKPLDRRSDIFALAVVMYEMIAIKRLFHRDSDFMTFKAITEEPIPDIRDKRPDIPPGLRAALLQAMARDPNGRFDTAKAFGEAIRNSVATLGGPASQNDLARMLFTDFGDEMASRDEILRAADDPGAAPATSTIPPSNQFLSSATTIGPAPAPTRSGELAQRPRTPSGPPSSQMPVPPSMIVNRGSQPNVPTGSSLPLPPPPLPLPIGSIGTAPPPPGSAPVPSATIAAGAPNTGPIPLSPPTPATPWPPSLAFGAMTPSGQAQPLAYPPTHPGVLPDLSASMPPDTWLADPATDILRAHRRRTVRNAVIALALVGVSIAGVAFLLSRGGTHDNKAAVVPIDAGVRVVRPPPPDAATGMSHDDIVSLSRYGFFSLQASGKTNVFIDDKLIGETPLTRLPLTPGVYKVKAVGPHGKTKKLEITIYGGKDTDQGTITW